MGPSFSRRKCTDETLGRYSFPWDGRGGASFFLALRSDAGLGATYFPLPTLTTSKAWER